MFQHTSEMLLYLIFPRRLLEYLCFVAGKSHEVLSPVEVSAVEIARVVSSCLVGDVGMSFLSGCVETVGAGKESLQMITICHAWFSLMYTSHGGNTDNNHI